MLIFWIWVNIKIILLLFIYGICMGILRRRFYQKMFQKRSGSFLINLLNFVGTPVHELGHFVFAILFGMQVTEVCFYRTLGQATDHKLGYVNVRMRSGGVLRIFWNSIGSFFVGIGPLLMGPAVILAISQILPSNVKGLFALRMHFNKIPIQLEQWNITDWIVLILFLYLVIGIALNLELSPADIRMAWKGFIFLELVLCFVSITFFHFAISYMPVLDKISELLLTMSAIGGVGALIGVLLA